MSEEKIEFTEEQEPETAEPEQVETAEEAEESSKDESEELSEQYKKLPVWKQVVMLVLILGGMTAVIMLINFIVEFGSELIKALLR